MRFDPILLATDLGHSSKEALSAAVQVAETTGSSLILLHVYDPPPGLVGTRIHEPPPLLDPLAQRVELDLEGLLLRVRNRVPRASCTLRYGSPAEEILAEARDSGATLIVMGTHGRRGIRRMILGSVSRQVVRSAEVSVLTVPAVSNQREVSDQSRASARASSG